MAVKPIPSAVLGAIERYRRLRMHLDQVERQAKRFRDAAAARVAAPEDVTKGVKSRDVLDRLFVSLTSHRGEIASLTSGGGDIHAVSQFVHGPKFDGVKEWSAALAAMDSAARWIKSNFPVSDGFFQELVWARDGSLRREEVVLPLEFQKGLLAELDGLISALSA